MKDCEPFFQLVPHPGSAVTPELLAFLDKCAEASNHALEVTYREEWELTRAEFTEACLDHVVSGGPTPDVEKIAARFATFPFILSPGPAGPPGAQDALLDQNVAPRKLRALRVAALLRTLHRGRALSRQPHLA